MATPYAAGCSRGPRGRAGCGLAHGGADRAGTAAGPARRRARRLPAGPGGLAPGPGRHDRRARAAPGGAGGRPWSAVRRVVGRGTVDVRRGVGLARAVCSAVRASPDVGCRSSCGRGRTAVVGDGRGRRPGPLPGPRRIRHRDGHWHWHWHWQRTMAWCPAVGGERSGRAGGGGPPGECRPVGGVPEGRGRGCTADRSAVGSRLAAFRRHGGADGAPARTGDGLSGPGPGLVRSGSGRWAVPVAGGSGGWSASKSFGSSAVAAFVPGRRSAGPGVRPPLGSSRPRSGGRGLAVRHVRRARRSGRAGV